MAGSCTNQDGILCQIQLRLVDGTLEYDPGPDVTSLVEGFIINKTNEQRYQEVIYL